MDRIDLKTIKKPFFLGIGGIGISAIARMLMSEGKTVAGSDASDSEIIAELRKAGAKVTIGQSADLVPDDADLIIYTVAIEVAEPKLIAELKKRPVPVLSYPEMLGLISKDTYTIAVSGTHGKTTTTAMIAKVLIDAGLEPTVIVGSLLKTPPQPSPYKGEGENISRTNFVAGNSRYFVVEACEYRRSFLNINPTIVVTTNIDNDHLDYYKDIPDIAKAFGELMAKVPKSGYVVTNAKDGNIKLATREAKAKIVDYAEFRAKNLKLKVPGAHNKENAAAVLAVAHILGVDKKKVMKSLEEFTGTWRRFEYKGKTASGALVYDDYGHHPTEIKATLAGARELYPKQRIVVVFQPHLYSRTKLLLNEFARAFRAADEVVLVPIYPAREAPDPTISSEILAEKIQKAEPNKKVSHFDKFEDAEEYLRWNLKEGDILITLGAGEAYKISDSLVDLSKMR